jgi:hypothetical protein
MRKPYCCGDESHRMYQEYYAKQQRGGGDFPVYIGAYHQRGHGIGNILGSFFRRIIPTLKHLLHMQCVRARKYLMTFQKGNLSKTQLSNTCLTL